MRDKDIPSPVAQNSVPDTSKKIAVLLPCYNEAITIKKVIEDFRRALPSADIFVCDNNSSDGTGELAAEAGATVYKEHRQGKGYAVRTLFERVEADIYIMADGDDTYPAEDAVKLIEQVQNFGYDMSVGNRLERYGSASFRSFHVFGNRMICNMVNLFFNANLVDILSGYRCFTNRFVKSIPLLKSGFEVETELTLQALDKGFPIIEVDIPYGERPEGSISKLNTWQDGIIIVKTIFNMLKNYRPLLFFGIMAFLSLSVGFVSGFVVVDEFMQTGLVLRLPLAVFSVGCVISGIIALVAGVILDTVNLRMKELWNLEMRRYGRG
jgi:glycosyltransferase involved in cell wall biosynthesis